MTQLMKTTELARKLGVDRQTVCRWVNQGRLSPTARTPGGVLLFSEDTVMQALTRKRFEKKGGSK